MGSLGDKKPSRQIPISSLTSVWEPLKATNKEFEPKLVTFGCFASSAKSKAWSRSGRHRTSKLHLRRRHHEVAGANWQNFTAIFVRGQNTISKTVAGEHLRAQNQALQKGFIYFFRTSPSVSELTHSVPYDLHPMCRVRDTTLGDSLKS